MPEPRRTPLLAIADGISAPATVPGRILSERPDLTPLVGWLPVAPPWVSMLTSGLTLMGGYALRGGLRSGAVRYIPVRYSRLPRMLESALRPHLTVVRGRPSPQGYRFSLDVAWAYEAAALADEVIVEVDTSLPPLDTPLIPGNIVAALDSAAPLELPPSPTLVDEADLAVGRLVAPLIPTDATVQWGAGGIPDAALRALDRPVHVLSGVVTDALLSLVERGLLRGQARADYVLGSVALVHLAAEARVRLGIRHSDGQDAPGDPFVSINTALEVGLDGSVNVERVGGIQVAGIGGHADYCARAAASPGGLSIIALPAQRRGHATIVERTEVVSTPRTDIDVVVTEYGVADLRALTDAERADSLIAIAHPSAREALERASREKH